MDNSIILKSIFFLPALPLIHKAAQKTKRAQKEERDPKQESGKRERERKRESFALREEQNWRGISEEIVWEGLGK